MSDNPFGDLIPSTGDKSQDSSIPSAPQMGTSLSPAANPFADLVGKPTSPEGPSGSNWFMDGVDLFNRQFEKPALGIMQMVLPKSMQPAVEQERAASKGRELNAWEGFKNPNGGYTKGGYIATGLGMLGSGASYMNLLGALGVGTGASLGFKGAEGIAKAAQIAEAHPVLASLASSNVAKGAAYGAELGAIDEADSGGERATKAIAGGILGAAIPAAIAGGKAVLGVGKDASTVSTLGEKIFSPSSAALKDKAFQVETALGATEGQPVTNAATKIQEAVAPGQALGMEGLTPGQVLSGYGTNALRKDEIAALSNAGIDERRAMQWAEGQNNTKLKSYITDTIKNMAPEETVKAKDVLYSQLDKLSINKTTADDLMKNPIINKAIAGLDESGATVGKSDATFASLPNNSVTKLDYTKQIIDSKLWNDKHSIDSANKLSPDVKNGLLNARAKIVNAIDEEHGTIYTPAREAAQKIAIQQNYTDLLAKVKGSESIPDGAFNLVDDVNKTHSVLFGNADKQAAFLKDVASTGGDVKQAANIMKVSGQLSNSTIEKVLNKSGQSMQDLLSSGNASGLFQKALVKLTQSGYDDALIKLTLSGKQWQKDITHVLAKKAGSEEQAKSYILLLGRVLGNLNAAKNKAANSPLVQGGVAGETSKKLFGTPR